MKEFLFNLWEKFKKASIIFKMFICLLLVLYIGVLVVCFSKVKVNSSLPGSITNVSSVIDIESKNEPGNIYTVSIYSPTEMSLLEYWLASADKNSDVSKGQSIQYDIFTEKEYYNTNVGYKNQSIQDSIIVAYNAAIQRNFDVKLEYEYEGEYLINIPQNLYKTGSDDIKIGDVVTKINDVEVESLEQFNFMLDLIFDSVSFENTTVRKLKETGKFILRDENNKTIKEHVDLILSLFSSLKEEISTVKFIVNRNNKEIEINPSYKMLLFLYTSTIVKESKDGDMLYSVGDTRFSKYTIDYENCSPKINISKSTTVGPSGGLVQTLAVYNAITPNDVTGGLRVMGTGGINLQGYALNIGGEQQKVVTANLYGANVFFVPEGNYDSAKEMYDKLDEKTFDLVKVNNFKDVLDYLEMKVAADE